MIKKYIWDESIATGIPEIDLQHKQFFVVLHDFADDLERGTGANSLKKMLMFLKYYGEWHFGKEEGCAARHVCPMAKTNIQAHHKYMETVDALITQCRNSVVTEELAHSAYEALTDWLVNHIMKIDKQIGTEIRLSQEDNKLSS
jgi:hemerythrin